MSGDTGIDGDKMTNQQNGEDRQLVMEAQIDALLTNLDAERALSSRLAESMAWVTEDFPQCNIAKLIDMNNALAAYRKAHEERRR